MAGEIANVVLSAESWDPLDPNKDCPRCGATVVVMTVSTGAGGTCPSKPFGRCLYCEDARMKALRAKLAEVSAALEKAEVHTAIDRALLARQRLRHALDAAKEKT